MTHTDRPAARVTLVDFTGRTLLFRGGDPARPGRHWQVDVAGCDAAGCDAAGCDADERAIVDAHRWWSADELDSTTTTDCPEDLPALLRRCLAVGAGGTVRPRSARC